MQELIDDIDAFIKKLNVQNCLDSAGTSSFWDFNTAIRQTMVEKYQSFHCKIVELSNVLIRKGAKGYFWIVCSPEVASMFDENMLYHSAEYEYHPMGISEKQYMGTIGKKWRVYTDLQMSTDKALIGCNCCVEPISMAKIIITNYIV